MVHVTPLCNVVSFPQGPILTTLKSIFQNGTRADILDLTEGTIYEILCSETEEKYEEKIKNYPKELKIIKVKCYTNQNI